ncbi:peroxiredoxin family protein [sulfur-oxidizing endosymbiont of Gigantopelta aegis]|uniref:peroxiredoxin family protein n=1 Tax=sulfur-oxidizing endosymbiont of Gigantopelta aegis TaxID=2794934 RepID=UPI0018DE8764|nr:TlpA family protein disulfide reductase [sulfur-oxidizing endosymbiont of Gigantopelta aegis]
MIKLFYKTILVGIFLLLSNNVFSEQSLTVLDKPIMAPDFSLQDMDGKTHKLSDYRGQPVIINFWATWCPPCREEMPSMERAWNKIKDQGIAMLAINVGESEDAIFTFTGNYPVSFTLLLDTTGTITEQWPVKGLPTTFVVSPEGKLVYRAVGGREWDDEELLDHVRKLKKNED